MFNFSSNHRGHFLQIQSAAVGVTRQLLSAAPERAALISRTQGEVRWPGPTIERCCARIQMILNQFARSSRFSYRHRPIAFARWRLTDFLAVSRQSVAGRVACARPIVQQHLVSARQRHCQSLLALAARHSAGRRAQLRDSLTLAPQFPALALAAPRSRLQAAGANTIFTSMKFI